ncbi:hypothetical protein DPMN_160024 [Dreissena polymorpha]|uniref:Uncharacterized protein n=1 Tax=Dreissena polymorpha TaxID=45954 RepID=A0A9D4EMQ1_DREPO|nr:hypothetical protein DPMN_160024 [Dreissena polymorpha]
MSLVSAPMSNVSLGGLTVTVALEAKTLFVNVSRLLSLKEIPVPCDDNDYYSFKTLSPGITIHELWVSIHEKCRIGSAFFEEEFKTFNEKTGIIVFRKPTETQLPMFWSHLDQLGSILRKDGTHATKGPSSIKEAQQNGYVEITYSITHETFRDKTIKHFVLSSWKEVDIPIDKKPLLEMIGTVHTWQSEMADDSLILILDRPYKPVEVEIAKDQSPKRQTSFKRVGLGGHRTYQQFHDI